MSRMTIIKRRCFFASLLFCALHWIIVILLFSVNEIHHWQLIIMQLCGIASLLALLLACGCGAVQRLIEEIG